MVFRYNGVLIKAVYLGSNGRAFLELSKHFVLESMPESLMSYLLV